MLRPGDLLFTRERGPVAWFVRWWTRPSFWLFWQLAPFAHCGIVVLRDDGTLGVQEAHSRLGVRTCSPREFAEKATLVAGNLEWNLGIMVYADSQEGKPYGWWDDVRVGLGLEPRENGVQCAELCAGAWRAAGRLVPPAPNPSNLYECACYTMGGPGVEVVL